MFPEVVGKSHEFAHLAFDEMQTVCGTDYSYPMTDHFEKYLVKNRCSWQGGLIMCIVPEVLPTFNLTSLYPIDEIQWKVTANLAKNTNFVFEKVSITISSDIMMTPSGIHTFSLINSLTDLFIWFQKPMRTGQVAAVATALDTFFPITLIMFGCVAIHYVLEVEILPNGTAHPQRDCKTYNVHYTTYMDSLQAFTVSHPDESLAVQKFLWNSGW
ncbi:hypothetical protein K439DRAFT_1624802 [Ramaria rubella]|nr:hypothetical protein K439DRAFT_1624802 [Ramaria rubella]